MTGMYIFIAAFLGFAAGIAYMKSLIRKELKSLLEKPPCESVAFKSGVLYTVEWIKAML